MRGGGGRLAGLALAAWIISAAGVLIPAPEVPAAQAEGRGADLDLHPSTSLAFALRPGAEVDVRPWRFRRPVQAPSSPQGLVRLPLEPEDLAAARPDLADLRLVDGEHRQWAYLLVRDARQAWRSLEVVGVESREGTSRYLFDLPAAPATVDRLALETELPFFDRAFVLSGRREGAQRVLTRGRLVRRGGAGGPVELEPAAGRLDALVLEVEDGDDAPLEWSRARARLPLPDLYFVAPASEYALLLGHPEADPPRYELERVRARVLAAESADAQAGELAPNPDFRRRARWRTDRGLGRVLLWGSLALAVSVLAGLTLKLARREGA